MEETKLSYKKQTTMGAHADKPYSEVGKLLDSLARKRDVRGPYYVARWVTQTTGHQISGQAVSRVFYGAAHPRTSFIVAFTEAFDLSMEERDSLAWLYTYGEELPEASRSTLGF